MFTLPPLLLFSTVIVTTLAELLLTPLFTVRENTRVAATTGAVNDANHHPPPYTTFLALLFLFRRIQLTPPNPALYKSVFDFVFSFICLPIIGTV